MRLIALQVPCIWIWSYLVGTTVLYICRGYFYFTCAL